MAAGAALADIGRVTDSTLQGASVLVVEDEPLLRKQVAAALEQHDADVTAVGTLDEARRMIQSLPFDFALLDVNLGDEQSVPVAKRLAELGVPFVLSTGYGETPELIESYPPCPVVQKPFSNESLRSAFAKAMSR